MKKFVRVVGDNKWSVAVLLYMAVMLSAKQQFLTYDLGRHLKAGELLVEQGVLIGSNYFSHTMPDFEVINHHWLAGGVFYVVDKFLGFGGLSALFVGLWLVALGLVLWADKEKQSDKSRGLSLLAPAPLLTQRAVIRPEVFSVLGLGLYWWVFMRVRVTKKSGWLWLLPVVMVAWVNLHIYFVFGLLLGLWVVQRLVKEKAVRLSRGLSVLGLTLAAVFLNPHGLEGAWYPFRVMENYGYEITENQPVGEYLRYVDSAYVWQFVGLLAVTVVAGVWGWRRKKVAMWELGLLGFTGVMGWLMIRNIWVFGMFFVALFGRWVELMVADGEGKKRRLKYGLAAAAIGVAGWLQFETEEKYYLPRFGNVGWGLDERVVETLAWWEQSRVEGEVFNNYDVGGFVIYAGFPETRVFVDNRPEAYKARFFDEYVRLQREEEYWKQREEEFDWIVFAYTDQTPWAKPFLSRRLEDEAWEMVYKDEVGLVVFERVGGD